MRRFALVSLYVLLVAPLGACGEGEDPNAAKKDYEAAAIDLTEPIGEMAAYLPYLETPKADGKYDPRPAARDVGPRKERAANAIRFAAAAARQRSKTEAVKQLGPALADVGRGCTRAEEDDAVKKCKDAINALDAELEKLGKAASEAGATAKIPRIGPEAITPKSKKELEPYLRALGPTPKEVVTLKALNDKSTDVAQFLITCDEAAEEQKLVEKTFEGKDEELRKLAVKHRFAIEAVCRAVRRVDALQAELKPCEEKKNIDTPECKLACSKGKNILEEGMPAAAQETFPDYYKGICEEEDGKK